MLVELACSATIAPAYKRNVFNKLVPSTGKVPTVVLVLCGGFKVSLDDMEEWRRTVAADVATGGQWEVAYNGETFTTPKTA